MSPSELPAPLLEAADLRIDIEGAVALERASFSTNGRSLAVAGEVTTMMSALAGVVPIRAGTLRLLGHDVPQGEHLPLVGLAPLDPVLPPSWTALEYLAWSARLAGFPKSSATQLAREALSAIDASSLGSVRLGVLGVAERRVVVLAHAIVAKPEVVVASMPLANLEGPPLEYVRRAFDRAVRDRAWIVSVARLDPGSTEYALARDADESLVFGARSVLHGGSVEEYVRTGASTYSLTVSARAEALRACLLSRGIELRGGPREFWVRLTDASETQRLLEASVEAEAPIVRLLSRKEC